MMTLVPDNQTDHHMPHADHQPPIDWQEGSALELPIKDSGFDVVLCQLGLQMATALSSARQLLLPW
jgi:ubiquinone/menaquinone biosynthesis C-methylase UbiE